MSIFDPKPARPKPERDVMNAIRIALSKLPGVIMWRNSSGVADIGGRVQRFGLARGSSDLIGAIDGRFAAIEVKNERGRVSPEQEQFLRLVRSKGGFACVVRSVQDAMAAVERARSGLLE